MEDGPISGRSLRREPTFLLQVILVPAFEGRQMGIVTRRRRSRKVAFGAEMVQEPTQGMFVTSLKSSLASGFGEKTIYVFVDT